ncbi:YidC/Oxa1 family membrane protein insertase [Glaciihabitans sp. UYNi722]|uniref:YidC/Oxa1 family membrane protein insertase n=1 Tax=Glaciihabitans sp. UYNi722 TaxID=3156344 RepID=UPI0033970C3B
MDIFAFPPIAFLLNAAYAVVEGLSALFDPIAGAASAVIAIIVLTLLVRTALIPVGASQVKAEWTRRRLAPMLQALQRTHKKNPPLLQQKTMELYKAENASPFAGILPALAQAPVLSLVYALFIRTIVDGHPNALLSEHMFGVPLGTSFLHLASTGGLWPGGALYLVLFAVMAGVAWISRRIALNLALPVPDAAAPMAGLGRALSWLPFITVIFAAFVPLAAALYLVTTTAWTLAERILLRRRYWREAEPPASTQAAVAS